MNIDINEPAVDEARRVSGPMQFVRKAKSLRRYSLQVVMTSVPLLLTDILAVSVAILLGFSAGEYLPHDPDASPFRLILFMCGSMPVLFYFFRLYPGTGLSPILELRKICIATLLLFAAFVIASLFHDLKQGYPFQLAFGFGISVLALLTSRAVTRRFFSRFEWWGQPMLIFGSNEVGNRIYKHYASNLQLGLRPIGFVDESIAPTTQSSPYLGSFEMAKSMARKHHAHWVAVAFPDARPSELRRIVENYTSSFPHVLIIHDTRGLPSLWNRTCECAGLLGIQMQSNLMLPLPRLIKRSMDVTLVCLASILVVPIAIIVALVIKMTSPGPIFYRQGRVGFGEKRFAIWKFRTMVKDADLVLEQYLEKNPELKIEWERDSKLKHDVRITAVGRVLRLTSLDELPQLWNVLKGDMSLVGPRPIMNSEFEKYSSDDDGFRSYKKVRPGITGLWQISGRSDTTYAERIYLDSYYVRNWSPWIDMYILFMTIRAVIRCEGAR